MRDVIKGTVLQDGVVKLTTDAISADNHTAAERMIRAIEERLGGETEVERQGGLQHHQHQHEQERH